MAITSVENLEWVDADHTRLRAVVTFDDGRVWPMCVHGTYDTDEGLDLWTRANAGDFGAIADYVAPPEPTPEEIRAAMPALSAKQIRLGLLSLGKLDGVDAAIDAMSEPDRSQAKIQWEYATEFHRLHPLIVNIMPLLGLTDDQVDTAWMQFAQVE
ncbi:MAG: hypothetical protein J0H18_17640 [Rhizobiales bacterium]|nr:hypothetical protein [Hyphomicrobiales bacterium]OJY06686.1 MAG: hypothetical protein BGP07_16730 [Rhizobiales bacterium 63-22]